MHDKDLLNMQLSIRKPLFLILIFFIFLTAQAQADELDAKRNEMVKYFKSDEEPKVIDAIWTMDNVFKVGVYDDGSRRDGYAQYVCMVLKENGFRGKEIYVQVIDYAKLMQTKKWIKLGETFCD